MTETAPKGDAGQHEQARPSVCADGRGWIATWSGGGLAAAMLVLTVLLPGSVSAAGEGAASKWSEGYNSRIRLLGGTGAAAGQFRAAIEIAMPKGWKTYWRNPGDAGIPPTFDFSASENVASVVVHYPAPSRIVDKGGTTIGYTDRVLFPVSVAARDPARPVQLRIAAEFGVCKDICVPAAAAIELPLDVAATPPAAAVEQAFARLPSARGRERDGDPRIASVTAAHRASPPRLVVEASVPGDPAAADLFAVADDGGFVPLATREPSSTPGTMRFVVDLSKDIDVKDLAGKSIEIVVTGATGATTTAVRLD